MLEVEIEYKQLLSVNEYRLIFAYFLSQNSSMKKQINYYFENNKSELKKQNKALRIREVANTYELCLKEKRRLDLIENNIKISKEDCIEIFKNTKLLHNYYMNLPSDLRLLGSLTTKRVEYQTKDGLYCLDKSTYNGIVDYEIEFEAIDYNKKHVFIDFLEEFNIVYNENKVSKIQRFSQSLSKRGK